MPLSYRSKTIYSFGLLSVVLSLSLILLWLYFQASSLIWVGLVLSPVAFLIVVLTALYGIFGRLESKSAAKAIRYPYRHLVGHVFVLSLGLVISFQSFNLFRHKAASHLKVQNQKDVTVVIKNTSGREVKNIYVSLDKQSEKIDTLDKQQSTELRFILDGENAVLNARIGEATSLRQTELEIDKSTRSVFLNIDFQHNILPEVQVH